MTLELDGTFVLIALLVPACLLVAVGTSPRWFVRSMGKHALWRLRDDLVDDTLAARLDPEHPAVRELTARVEWALGEARSFDLVHLFVWSRARRRIPPETLRKLEAIPRLTGLPVDQAERISAYRTRYRNVAIRTILLSSWVGILVVFRYGVRAALEALRRRARDNSFIGVVRTATDEVASETTIGRSAREFVTDKGPDEKYAALV